MSKVAKHRAHKRNTDSVAGTGVIFRGIYRPLILP